MSAHRVHFAGVDYYALVSIVIRTVAGLDILFHRTSTFRLVRQNKRLWFLGCAVTYVIVLSPLFALGCRNGMVPNPNSGPRRSASLHLRRSRRGDLYQLWRPWNGLKH